MSARETLKTVAFVLLFAIGALLLFIVANILFVAASFAWGLALVGFLVLVVPLCAIWTIAGFLSFHSKGWKRALGDTYFRLAVSLFAAAIVGDIFGVLTTDEHHTLMLSVLVMLMIPGVLIWAWDQLRRRIRVVGRGDPPRPSA